MQTREFVIEWNCLDLRNKAKSPKISKLDVMYDHTRIKHDCA